MSYEEIEAAYEDFCLQYRAAYDDPAYAAYVEAAAKAAYQAANK